MSNNKLVIKGVLIIKIFDSIEELLGDKVRKLIERKTGITKDQLESDNFYPYTFYKNTRFILEAFLGQSHQVMLFRVGYVTAKKINNSQLGRSELKIINKTKEYWRLEKCSQFQSPKGD